MLKDAEKAHLLKILRHQPSLSLDQSSAMQKALQITLWNNFSFWDFWTWVRRAQKPRGCKFSLMRKNCQFDVSNEGLQRNLTFPAIECQPLRILSFRQRFISRRIKSIQEYFKSQIVIHITNREKKIDLAKRQPS